MRDKSIIYFAIISLLVWLLPFVIGLFFTETYKMSYTSSNISTLSIPSETNEIFLLVNNGDKFTAFLLIFKINLKSCLLNIMGGVLLGFGTFVNLLSNGFYSGDVFATSHMSGISVESIFWVTLPHSFELIGFWLSGAIGFYIAWNIVRFMRGKEMFKCFYRQVALYSLVVFLIILLAAYAETYVSIS